MAESQRHAHAGRHRHHHSGQELGVSLALFLKDPLLVALQRQSPEKEKGAVVPDSRFVLSSFFFVCALGGPSESVLWILERKFQFGLCRSDHHSSRRPKSKQQQQLLPSAAEAEHASDGLQTTQLH